MNLTFAKCGVGREMSCKTVDRDAASTRSHRLSILDVPKTPAARA
jgi:hypothetical protein